MQIKKIPKLFIVLTLLIVNKTIAQVAKIEHKFTLQQAVDYAQKNNVQVKNALLNVQIQGQTNRSITAAALPNVSANIGTTYYIDIPTQLIPGQVFGGSAGTYIPVQFGTKYTTTGGLQLQQLLFDGQVFVGLQARNASMKFQNKAVEITEEAIKVNINKILSIGSG